MRNAAGSTWIPHADVRTLVVSRNQWRRLAGQTVMGRCRRSAISPPVAAPATHSPGIRGIARHLWGAETSQAGVAVGNRRASEEGEGPLARLRRSRLCPSGPRPSRWMNVKVLEQDVRAKAAAQTFHGDAGASVLRSCRRHLRRVGSRLRGAATSMALGAGSTAPSVLLPGAERVEQQWSAVEGVRKPAVCGAHPRASGAVTGRGPRRTGVSRA